MSKKVRKTQKPVIPNRVARSTQPNPGPHSEHPITRMPERAEFSPKDPVDAYALLATVPPASAQEEAPEPVTVKVPVPLNEEHVVVAVPRSIWRKISDAMNWTKRDE